MLDAPLVNRMWNFTPTLERCLNHCRYYFVEGSIRRLRTGGAQEMIFPSITTLILGLASVAMLSFVDWYLWRPPSLRWRQLDSSKTRYPSVEDQALEFKKVA